MDILSYRGPGMAGGVSAGLARVWSTQQQDGARWWYRAGSNLEMMSATGKTTSGVEVPHSVLEGHYRYSNGFLWPVMHDMPERATYSAVERYLYRQFNLIFAHNLSSLADDSVCRFVQDYQLALLPGLLNVYSNNRTLVFWHIPWPKNVDQLHVPPLVEIARGLLGATVIGFHTQEYAENFARFVARYLPGCSLESHQLVVRRPAHPLDNQGFPWVSLAQTVSGDEQRLARARSALIDRLSYGQSLAANAAAETKIMVAPLGIDLNYWKQLAADAAGAVISNDQLPIYPKPAMVLSVDRADYTKSVFERIECIDRYFARYPGRRGRMSFVQVCGKTRHDLPAFERYWDECRARSVQLNARWSKPGWRPLTWIESPMSSADLACLYRTADIMLVNPARDGLNLTAKEYVACQPEDNPGVLLLSRGAGAWQELQPYALEVDPANLDQMVNAIERAALMTSAERSARMQLMQRNVQANTLDSWWQQFVNFEAEQPIRRSLPDKQIQIS